MQTTLIDKIPETSPNRINTTLYDLIYAMQETASCPADDALVVPTVMRWLDSGRIILSKDNTLSPAA